MSIGFIYAGQGSQKVGMGQDFYNQYETFRNTLDNATQTIEAVTAVDLAELSFNGPIELLSQTRMTQPAMVAFAIGVTKLLKEAGINPEYSCGLSLGEYSALYESGVFDENTALELVAKRGKYMTDASKGLSVKMSAVLGMDRPSVIACCEEAEKFFNGEKVVSAANFNCPGQIVISGDSDAVEKAEEFLKEAGAKRILPLNVSGPFHTALMKPAGDLLAKDFSEISFGEMNSKVIFNCLGREKTDSENIAQLLEKQVQSSVYLEDSIKYMAEHGVDVFVEIGPGNAISKFVKKTVADAKVYSIDKVEDFEALKEELVACV